MATTSEKGNGRKDHVDWYGKSITGLAPGTMMEIICGWWLRLLPARGQEGYKFCMIRIRFSDEAAKRRALGFLAGRFSFKSWATGEMLVPEHALAPLAQEGIFFLVEGPATYEQIISAFRIPPATAV